MHERGFTGNSVPEMNFLERNSDRTGTTSADKQRRCRKGLIVSRFLASFITRQENWQTNGTK